MGHFTALPGAHARAGTSAHKLSKLLLGGGFGLLLALVPAGHTTAQLACVTPPSGMVSWWDGDDVSGSTAFDIQGGNDGTLMGGTAMAPGKVGQAFSFDGSNDFVRVSSVADIEVEQFTIDAWVFAESAGSVGDVVGGIIVTKDIGNTTVTWDIVGPGTTGLFSAGLSLVGGGGFISSTKSFSFNEFHHVAATWDGSIWKLYVNGQLEASLTTAGDVRYSVGDPLTIGDHNLSPQHRAFDGLIDEVEFFNRALSASEIKAIFDAGSDGKCKPS